MIASIILPTYNEVGNINALIRACIEVIPAGWDYEIIVVDDNSPDGTFDAVEGSFSNNPKVVPILRETGRGLANSIRVGVNSAQGDVLIIMDTDFAHDPAEIPRMLHISEVADIVIGSRFCAGGDMDDVPHYIWSLVYNWFIRVVLGTQIQDNLSGFLAIRSQRLRLLPFDRVFVGYGDYCFKLLHHAQLSGLSVIEIPVRYQRRHAGKSKSVFPKLLFTYTRELLRLKIAILRGSKRATSQKSI